MKIEIDHEKPVNIDELKAEIEQRPGVQAVKIVRIPQTKTIEGTVQYLGYEIEIIGKGADLEAIEQIITAHEPQQTTEEAEAAANQTRRFAEFDDIIEEAVRRAKL